MLRLDNAYDARKEVGEVGSGFDGLDLQGKHCNVILPIHIALQYQLDVALKHGNVNYSESDFEITKHIEKDSELIVQGKKKNAGINAAMVKIRGEDVKVELRL